MLNNFIEYFEKTANQYPIKKAIVEKNKSINFKSLRKKSLILAYYIQKFICKERSSLVAVYIEKSIELIICNIATTYSGNFFVNLDPINPAKKNFAILKNLNPKIILTDKKNFSKIDSKIKDKFKFLVYEDIIKKNLSINNIEFNYKNRIDTDPYCIINTSGSTGTPKGVVLNHKNFFNFMEWTKYEFNYGKKIIIGSLSPSVFDIFNFEIFMMAFNSSTVVIVPNYFVAFPYEILKFLKKKKVNFIFWVPTIMVNIANLKLLDKINMKDIKNIWFAGEVFPTRQFNYWRNILHKTNFVNLYGPIEITLDCTFFKIKDEINKNNRIPIGYSCKNTEILLLNKKDQICKTFEEGEICVRGSSVALGYYNDPDNTKKKFVQNPLNKNYPEIIYRTGDFAFKNNKREMIFVGRRDNQIKHFGYRIELSEIEHAIFKSIKKVRNSCIEYNFGQKKIIMFYEANSIIKDSFFLKKLKKYLPNYMLPKNFVFEKKMKMNINGKIDRLYYKKKANKS